MLLWYGESGKTQLVANFSGTPTSGCSPLLVGFRDLSTGNPISWSWDLGNGTTSILQHPTVTYFASGQYSIKLVIRNAGGSDSITKVQYITVHAAPIVNFIAAPRTGCYPLPVQFTDQSSPGSGSINSYQWDFGDGNSATTQNPLHVYTGSGNFNVSLRIINSLGCTKTLTLANYIVISSGVHANFTQTVLSSCNPPATVNFQNLSTGVGNLSYQWTFGDGGTSTATNPSHLYATGGTYTVKLVVLNSIGCTDTLVRVNAVTIGTVVAGFTSPDTVCAGTLVPIINNSMPIPSTMLWNFGDGSTSTSFTPVKVYPVAGNYIIKLVENFGACADSMSRSIIVLPKPVISFSSLDTASCLAPFTVHFTSSIISATTFQWDFGDGSTSPLQNPTHTYSNLGSFDVTLTAVNSLGCTNTLKKVAYINIDVPHVTLPGLPFKGCAPLTRIMNPIIISVDPVISYQWNFGDSSTSTLANPTHTWVTPGIYSIVLIVTTSGGCTDTSHLINQVLVGSRPVINFIATPRDACAKMSISFNDLSTGNPDQWLWRFGDGSTSTLRNPSHKYTDTGYFTVTLIAYNNGCADSATFINYIHISPPVALFNVAFSCHSPNVRNFTDASIGANSWVWDFGDGNSSILPNPSHSYSTSGNYLVSLVVTNFITGCTDNFTTLVTVMNEHADFVASDTVICKGSFAYFHTRNLNISNIRLCSWKFGDGSVLTDTTGIVSHQYLTRGNFTVTLIITDILGCQDTLIKSIYIFAGAPYALFKTLEPGTCISTTVNFIDSSLSDGIHPINSWIWNYGDGTVQSYSVPPFQHSYILSGIYSVALKVIDSYGCSDSVNRPNYIIVSKPIASFTTSDTFSCPNKPVTFLNSSSGPGLTYQWLFGDGTGSTLQNPVHQYVSDGLYTIVLRVVDQYGCSDSLRKQSYIRISTPHARFSMSDSVGTCPPLVLTFANQSINFISHIWDFGDGTTSTLDSPTHFYSSPGLFNVKLSIVSSGGCTDQKIRLVTVRGPRGILTYNNIVGCVPLLTNFQAHTPDHLTFIWDFNDGTTVSSADSVISHVYPNPGVYVPKLILVDLSGCQVPIIGTDTINVFGIHAKYSFNTSTTCDSGYVQFTNTSTVIGSEPSYLWTFGDGSVSSIPNPPPHFYASPGIYQTSLIAKNQSCADTAREPIPVKVVRRPSTRIVSDSALCVPASFLFTGQMIIQDTSAITWQWEFGNGNTSTLQNPPPQIYSEAGFYTVRSVSMNSSGCTDTIRKTIQVYPLPKIRITADSSICYGQSTILKATGGLIYTWSPIRGLSCNTCANPVASPDSSINYMVIGNSNFGCFASDTFSLVVQQHLLMSVGRPDTVCLGKSVALVASGTDFYSWSPLTGLSDPHISNPIARPQQDIIYQVIGTDKFGCFSDTGFIPIRVYSIPLVNAGTDKTINVGQSVAIMPVLSADVTGVTWIPSTGIASYSYPGIVVRPNVTTEYQVIVSNSGHCKAADRVTVYVICNGANIFIPNTFSPNGDGVNDIFYVRGTGVFKVRMLRIFNRWGEVMFEGPNIEANDASKGWDGSYKGRKLPPDVFIYTVDILCDNNTVLTYKGNITLLQ